MFLIYTGNVFYIIFFFSYYTNIQVTLFTEPEDEKIYPDYFNIEELISVRQKSARLLIIIDRTWDRLKEIATFEISLHKYWYKLKKTVEWLHRVYKLLYAVVKTFITKINSRCSKHNLLYGPRNITTNVCLLRELLILNAKKVKIIREMVKVQLQPNFLNNMASCFVKINRSADKLFNIYWTNLDRFDSDGHPLTIDGNIWD